MTTTYSDVTAELIIDTLSPGAKVLAPDGIGFSYVPDDDVQGKLFLGGLIGGAGAVDEDVADFRVTFRGAYATPYFLDSSAGHRKVKSASGSVIPTQES
jgi:hypothetical protein